MQFDGESKRLKWIIVGSVVGCGCETRRAGRLVAGLERGGLGAEQLAAALRVDPQPG